LTSEELANVPFLILGNKIDLGRAASEEDLRYQLGLFETYGKETKERDPNVRPIELYMCSVVRKMGYGDGEFFSFILCLFLLSPHRSVL
jgi:GTP-binding protein SAR1